MKNTLITFTALALCLSACKAGSDAVAPPNRLDLSGDWQMQSSVLETAEGGILSKADFAPQQWHGVRVPTTVLNALTKLGVYPDLRVGMNAYRIPDSSDEFNAQRDLAKFSHLPD